TDKITVEVPSVTGGVLKKRFAKEGDTVKLDQQLAEVDETASGGKTSNSAPAKAAPDAAAAPRSAPAAPSAPPREAPRASPAAQRTAAESGVNLANVQGTGRGGVVSKTDVLESRQPGAT